MQGRQQVYVLALHATVGLLVVVAATVLAALHDLDAQAAVAIFGAVIGLAGGSASSIAALGSTVNGKNVVTQETSNATQASLQAAVAYLAGARRELDEGRQSGGRRANDPPAHGQTAPAPPPEFTPDTQAAGS